MSRRTSSRSRACASGRCTSREGPRRRSRRGSRFLPALASLLAVAVERDQLVREAVEAEALRRSDAVKTTVLRAVSHDLRSPLTAIRVAGGTLRRSLASSSPPIATRCSTRSATRPSGSIGSCRTCSTCRGSRRARRAAARDLHARRPHRAGARRRSAQRPRVSTSRSPRTSPLVEVDAAQLERVLVNLLENALRFSPEDERVTVRVPPPGATCSSGSSIVARASPRPSSSTSSRPSSTGSTSGDARQRSRARDRAGFCRGERRPALGRVSAGTGRDLRACPPIATVPATVEA